MFRELSEVECHKIRKIIGSCRTPEQLETCRAWFEALNIQDESCLEYLIVREEHLTKGVPGGQ